MCASVGVSRSTARADRTRSSRMTIAHAYPSRTYHIYLRVIDIVPVPLGQSWCAAVVVYTGGIITRRSFIHSAGRGEDGLPGPAPALSVLRLAVMLALVWFGLV